MRILKIVILIFISLGLTQCATYDFARRVRQQGNLLPQEQIECLKPGMTKDEVAIILGTSLLSPVFNDNRWDYVYTLRKGNGPLSICKVSIYFKCNRLTHVDQVL